MLCVFQQAQAEQPVAAEVEGLDELRLFCLYVCHRLHCYPKCLMVVHRLQGLSVGSQLNAGEQRRVSCHCRFNSLA